MKRFLAILTLLSVMMVYPLVTTAGADGLDSDLYAPPGQQQGVEVPGAPQGGDGEIQDQQDTQGDPHELGGGFRGIGGSSGWAPPTWTGPVWTLIMQLV
jgi:hypothetical protein